MIAASADFAEWWVNSDLDDGGLDERTRLIRAYDRRQLRTPILERIEQVRAAEFKGTPTNRRIIEFYALQAAGGLLYDDYDWRHGAASEALRLTLAADHRLKLALEIYGESPPPTAFVADWRTTTAVSLARHMYESRDFSAMPILADALQDAGCDNADVLGHCRDPQATHVRGCWVVDLVLGKS